MYRLPWTREDEHCNLWQYMPGIRSINLTAALAILALAALASPRAEALEITDNLLAWWEFDGNTADLSGHGRNLLLADNPMVAGGGLPTFASGGVGGGMALQSAPVGSDNRLGLPGVPVATGFATFPDQNPDALDLSGASGFAVQAWVNFDALGTDPQAVVMKRNEKVNSQPRDGWEMVVGGSGTNVQFSARTGAGSIAVPTSNVQFGTGEWHHLLFTTDGIAHLYVDGVDASPTGLGLGGIMGSQHDLLVGASDWNPNGIAPQIMDWPLVGRLDKIALWNRFLTQAEVASLYNGGAGINLPAAAVPVPEPASLALAALGASALGAWRRRPRFG